MVTFRTRNKEYLHSYYIMPNSCTFFKYPDFKPFVRLENATLTLKYQTLILKFTLRFKVALGQQSNVKLHSYDNGFKRFLSISDSIFAKTQQEQWWGTENTSCGAMLWSTFWSTSLAKRRKNATKKQEFAHLQTPVLVGVKLL